MGRETKILLTLLGMLAGTFVGVLSAKLLVPRPPQGAGPDVHTAGVIATNADVVEPPALVIPPAAAEAIDVKPAVSAVEKDPLVVPAAQAEPLEPLSPPPTWPKTTTPPIAATPPPPPNQLPPLDPQATRLPPPPPTTAVAPRRVIAAASVAPAAIHQRPTAAHVSHLAAVGDSWWSLAEQAYGDGRLYRALFAWNRTIDSRVSLIPGTQIEVPPRSKLAAAWPKLVPPEK
ncbi:MAG: hypothetical protein WCI09_12095 [Planctomycetota bacterium]